MFVDASAVVAIIAAKKDASLLSAKLEAVPEAFISPSPNMKAFWGSRAL